MLNPITQVLDNLYLGDYMHAITKEALQAIVINIYNFKTYIECYTCFVCC